MSEASASAARTQKSAVTRRSQIDVVPGATGLADAFAVFAQAGLSTTAQWRILAYCCAQVDPPYLTQTGLQLDLAVSTVSREAKYLEGRGLMSRIDHPTNERLKLLAPTREGRRVVRTAAIVVLGGRP